MRTQGDMKDFLKHNKRDFVRLQKLVLELVSGGCSTIEAVAGFLTPGPFRSDILPDVLGPIGLTVTLFSGVWFNKITDYC